MADQSINLFQSGPLRNPEEMAFRSASSLQHHHRTEKFNSLTSPTCKQPVVPMSGMGDSLFLCQWLSKSIIVWTVGHLLGFKAGSKGREREGGSNLLLLLLPPPLLLFEIVVKASPPRNAGALGSLPQQTSLTAAGILASETPRLLSASLAIHSPAFVVGAVIQAAERGSAFLPRAALGQPRLRAGQRRRSSRSPAGAAAGPLGSAGGCPGPRHPSSFHAHTQTRCCPPFRRQLQSFLRPRRWDVLCTVFLTRRHVSHLQDEGRQGYGWRRGC